jgi:hypothetical protein
MVKFAGYSHDFKGKKADEVTDDILRWLNKEDAEIKISNKASELIAVHGSRTAASVLHRNARKTLFFNPIATKDGTQVQVQVHINWTIYFSGIDDWRRQIHVRNCALLEELWASIQGDSIKGKFEHGKEVAWVLREWEQDTYLGDGM